MHSRMTASPKFRQSRSLVHRYKFRPQDDQLQFRDLNQMKAYHTATGAPSHSFAWEYEVLNTIQSLVAKPVQWDPFLGPVLTVPTPPPRLAPSWPLFRQSQRTALCTRCSGRLNCLTCLEPANQPVICDMYVRTKNSSDFSYIPFQRCAKVKGQLIA